MIMFLTRRLAVIMLPLFLCCSCSFFSEEKKADSFDSAKPVISGQTGSSAGIVAGQVVQSAGDLDYDEKVHTQGQIIRHQERELNLQQKELEHLQRQEYYNKALEKYQKQ